MDNEFHELIDSIGRKLTSDRLEDVRAGMETLEELSAKAELASRAMWKEYQDAGGPIGAQRLEIFGKKLMIQSLLSDARKMERSLRLGPVVDIQGSNVRLISQKADYVDGVSRLDHLTAELSHRQIAEAIMNALVEEDGRFYYWPIDIFSDRVIYEASDRRDTVDREPDRLFRRSYMIEDDDTVTLGKVVAVKKETSYVEAVSIEDGKVRLVRKQE